MFNKSKYTGTYNRIIKRARERILEGDVYVEKHHIIPKSLGGSNKKDNIIVLTGKEHYIVHLLLPKMVLSEDDKKKMWWALWCMLRVKNNEQQGRYKASKASLYERAKIEAAQASREYWTGRKRGPRSAEHTRKQRESHMGQIPYIRTEEHRLQQSEANKGKHNNRLHTEEGKKNHSNTMKEKWQDPEYQAYMKEKNKNRKPRGPMPLKQRRNIAKRKRERDAAARKARAVAQTF